MRFGPKKSIALFGAAVVAALSLTACSDSDTHSTASGGSYSDGGAPIDSTQSGQGCFTEMTAQQKSELVAYANQQGNTVQNAGNNADGTQDICIVDSNGSQHYYKQDDHFGDYLLYSAMMSRAYGYGGFQPLLTYGAITGDLSPMEFIALSLLTGVGPGGSLYHPYSYTSAGWARQQSPVVVNNRTVTNVTNVYYGSKATPVSYQQAQTSKPAGYNYAPIPAANNTVADVEKGANGKPIVSTVPGTSASTALKGAVKTTPGAAPVKIAPPKANLGTATGTSKTGTTTTGGTSTNNGGATGTKTKPVTPAKPVKPYVPPRTTTKRR